MILMMIIDNTEYTSLNSTVSATHQSLLIYIKNTQLVLLCYRYFPVGFLIVTMILMIMIYTAEYPSLTPLFALRIKPTDTLTTQLVPVFRYFHVCYLPPVYPESVVDDCFVTNVRAAEWVLRLDKDNAFNWKAS